jgi:hypothetical protein
VAQATCAAAHQNRLRVSATTRAWLFVRGPESVRIVTDGGSIGVYGPGTRVSHAQFGEAMDATLHQAAVEQSLVHDGWTLERLTTERRAASRPPAELRHPERRARLRLVASVQTDRDDRSETNR